jgi:integrase
MALDFLKAMMALADWAGHTQKECATLTFDEIVEENGEMFIERDRNKTGVSGRWWIPPEAAEVIRRGRENAARSEGEPRRPCLPDAQESAARASLEKGTSCPP